VTTCRVPYTHGFQIKVTTKTCPKKDFGTVIGSALAYVTYIELLATFLIGGVFIGLGIAKPTHKGASFLNLLRGAGIAEIDKKTEGDAPDDESQIGSSIRMAASVVAMAAQRNSSAQQQPLPVTSPSVASLPQVREPVCTGCCNNCQFHL
jgi:hypothetical protein